MNEPWEIPLHGGNLSTVVRVGDTVRRQRHYWSGAVQRLLTCYADAGIVGTPRFYGYDSENRETLDYMQGEIGGHPITAWVCDAQTPFLVGRLLRQMHDASIPLLDDPDLPWQMRDSDPARYEVICHHDIAPYNAVWDGHRIAFIDFDTAGPGSRTWDLAYAAYRFAPFHAPQHAADLGRVQDDDRVRRLQALCSGYGDVAPSAVAAEIPARLQSLISAIEDHARAGDPAFGAMVEAGHPELYRNDLILARHLQASVRQTD